MPASPLAHTGGAGESVALLIADKWVSGHGDSSGSTIGVGDDVGDDRGLKMNSRPLR